MGQGGFPYGKGYKSYFICGYKHKYMYICTLFLHVSIYVCIHTRFLDKMSADFYLSAECHSFSPGTCIFPLWNASSHLSFERARRIPWGTQISLKGKVRQGIRELSHLQGRQQLSEGTHSVQRAGVWAPRLPGLWDSRTILLKEKCGRGGRQDSTTTEMKSKQISAFKIWWQNFRYFW